MSEFPKPKVKKTYCLKSLGTTREYIEIVECPECRHEYARKVSSGCFHHHVDPIACPKCGYPFKQLQEKVVNPSKRNSK